MPVTPNPNTISNVPTAAIQLLKDIGAPDTPDMRAAAEAWISLENGVNGNILGVTYTDATGQHLYKYSSAAAGLQAAADLLAHSSRYALTLAYARAGNADAFINALAVSGWNTPYYSTNNRLFNTYQSIKAGKYTFPALNSAGADIGGAIGGAVGGVVQAAQDAGKAIFDAASAPILFIGIVLIGITFLAVGGIVTLRKTT